MKLLNVMSSWRYRITMALICIGFGVYYHFSPPNNFPPGAEWFIIGLGPMSLLSLGVSKVAIKKFDPEPIEKIN